MNANDINPYDFFLDWFNNFITTQGIAEHYNITEDEASDLITEGRELYNKEASNHLKERA